MNYGTDFSVARRVQLHVYRSSFALILSYKATVRNLFYLLEVEGNYLSPSGEQKLPDDTLGNIFYALSVKTEEAV